MPRTNEEIIKQLPHTKDGVPILIGDTVFIENDDHSYWGESDVLELVVCSISSNLNQYNSSWYTGKFCIIAGDAEFGNEECYSNRESLLAQTTS